MEEYGHVVMLGVFDTVDDTVLVKKALLSVRLTHYRAPRDFMGSVLVT